MPPRLVGKPYWIWDPGAYLSLNEMANSDLGHDGNGNCVHDGLYHLWVTLSNPCQRGILGDLGSSHHSRNSTVTTDISGYTLQCHDCTGSSLFSNAGLMELSSISSGRVRSLVYLLGVYNIHDYTALKYYVHKDPTLRRGSTSQTLSIWASPDLTYLLDCQACGNEVGR